MKNILLTLGTILTLASCQDKFEQIDANFLYQQEQIAELTNKLDEEINILQSQIDANKLALDTDIQDLTDYVNAGISDQNNVNEFILQLTDELIDADAELKTYVDDLNKIQQEINGATVDRVAELENLHESVVADLNATFSDLETNFSAMFNELATSTQNGVANALNAINFDRFTTAWEINIDNSVSNTTTSTIEIVENVETNTNSSTTSPPPPPSNDVEGMLSDFYDDADNGVSINVNGVTVTRSSVSNLITFTKENGITQFFSPGVTGNKTEFIQAVLDYIG